MFQWVSEINQIELVGNWKFESAFNDFLTKHFPVEQFPASLNLKMRTIRAQGYRSACGQFGRSLSARFQERKIVVLFC